MKDSARVHQVTYSISIRSEYRLLAEPNFCGILETVAGQRFEFSTLAELGSLLCEIAGWIDWPPLAKEGGEANASHETIDAERGDAASDCSPNPKLTEGKK